MAHETMETNEEDDPDAMYHWEDIIKNCKVPRSARTNMHALFHDLIHPLTLEVKTDRQMRTIEQHLRLLFGPGGNFVRRYASSWTFPDGHCSTGHFVISSDSQKDVAVALLKYWMYDGTCSLEAVQGIKGEHINLLSVTEDIIRSWEPLQEAGWELFLSMLDRRKSIYPTLQSIYFQEEEIPPHHHHRLDINKPKVREILHIDQKKEQGRHREYLFE